ncbi:SdpI family protein [Flavobacterium supellecticarium]|uniref:SdpI family protein n=1 Tax=Flavobacterium supellecticarium TaxID=2565924 RepID=A0A4S3ZQ45_9FLAO|nr:SdpI family protein [Flavobacterium supellecticarium]THF47656.1 SdpI family protein [Flavobacterium supellecticarium]
MEWTTNLLQLPLLCGGIFILAGLIQYCFTPKKINSLYGYRTSGSMQSPERWEFAQKYSAIELIKGGGILIVLAMIPLIWPSLKNGEFVTSMALVLLFVFILIYRTEKALKKKFADNPK